MRKYGLKISAIAIVIMLWICVLVLGQRGRYDYGTPGTFDSIQIGNFTLVQDVIDNDGIEVNGSFHSAAVGGIAGNICIHDGNEPVASNSATGSRLWSDPNGVLHHQKSTNGGGGSRTVIVDDGSGNVGIGTDAPKRQFDFDGGNVRTQRYLDSDLNTNLGYETFGAGNLSGTYNSALGRQALYSITSGANNCAFGSNALYAVTSGGNNIAMGYNAEKAITEGNHNISLGYKSGYVISTGSNNISIGAYSNYAGTGSKNILIGYNIDLPIDAADNQLNIGNLIYGTGLDGVDKAVSTGKVGIGDTSPDNEFTVKAGHAASVSEGTYIKIMNNEGNAAGRNTGILLQGYDGTTYIKTGIFARTLDNFIRQDLIFALETTEDNSSVDTTDSKMIIKGDTGNVGIGTIDPTSKLQVVGLPVYANNAAAITGGLTAGAFYRTGGDPDLVCVVH